MIDKPCPFCGGTDIERSTIQFMQATGCRSCGASVLGGDWNKRSARADNVTEKPCLVANTVFSAGMPVDVILEAATAAYANQNPPVEDLTRDQAIAQLAECKAVIGTALLQLLQAHYKAASGRTIAYYESNALRAIARLCTASNDPVRAFRQIGRVLSDLKQQPG